LGEEPFVLAIGVDRCVADAFGVARPVAPRVSRVRRFCAGAPGRSVIMTGRDITFSVVPFAVDGQKAWSTGFFVIPAKAGTQCLFRASLK